MKLQKLAFFELIFLACIALILSSCDPSIYEKQERDKELNRRLEALSIALEANLKFRELSISCGFSRSKLVSKFIIIPLKKEVIDAVIKYKSALEGLSEIEEEQLLRKSYREFLESNKTTFILVVANNPTLDSSKDSLSFRQFDADVKLIGENRRQYKLVEYTSNFTANLNPGWNEGYLHFENFRRDYGNNLINSYAIHFDGYQMSCSDQEFTQGWAFSFDESEVNYLALIEKGLTKDMIRQRYVVQTYETIGLKESDIENIIKFSMKLVFPKAF